ncbi:hypothetical protein H4R20_000931 [Coemansia guatemalensis]|uniref:Xylulose kinase n=1 Tax=Coemansia guatemalensis TaxID=2761395 RepID=A0A9W8I4B8_9FUNG|nr:hypothetical protein H4R20_000931 [Coemansia guatemalensis]
MSTTNGPLFLGLDLSTQQLKGLLVDEQSRVVHEISIVLNERFPEYKTSSGRYVDGDVVTAPVLMWVEAIDLLMSELAASGLAHRVRGIGGAAQQHGSVYWRKEGVEIIQNLDSKTPLKTQLQNVEAFALLNSPIWEDTSTNKQCRELEALAGGAPELARITGSVAFERFTGTQIAKIKENHPDVWAQTARVSLVSSFVASVLAGNVVPVDCSDASGTNIYDVQARAWSRKLCDAIDPRLVEMLGQKVALADAAVGALSPYFVQRYGLSQCPILAFAGDNPAAFAGFESLFTADDHSVAVMSLGTSDTVLFPLDTYPYSGDMSSLAMKHLDGHILQHPTIADRYIAMLCYKNGSLAREWVRGQCLGADSSWDEFSKAAGSGPMAPTAFGFYYLSTEILPRAKGIHRFEKCTSGDIVCPSGAKYKRVDRFSDSTQGNDCRAIIESQLMSMCVDYAHKSTNSLTGVAVTGGASRNQALQQAIADVLGVSVFAAGVQTTDGFEIKTPAMPAYGGAVQAMHLLHSTQQADSSDGAAAGADKYMLQRICSPDNAAHAVYTQALADFEFLRDHVSSQFGG